MERDAATDLKDRPCTIFRERLCMIDGIVGVEKVADEVMLRRLGGRKLTL